MQYIFSLLAGIPFPAPPTLAGWVVWAFLLGALIYALIRWRVYQPAWKGREWGFFILFLILIPATSLFIGLRFSSVSARPLPGLPADAPGSALMIFSAIPLLLGGGLLGPIGGAILGAFAGALRGTWDTYSLFSILELAFIGVFFATNMHQRYRTRMYALLRQPIVGALLLVPFHVLFYTISALFTQWGMNIPGTARLDFALSNAGVVTLAFGGEMLIAGIVAQIVSSAFPSAWGNKQTLQPSPSEKSLEARFVFVVGAFITLLLLTLLVGDWVVAGRAAREMLEDRLSSAGQSAAQSVPFFLETGQNLAVQLASEPRLLDATGEELTSLIGSRIQTVPYFDQAFIFDANTQSVLAGYPETANVNFVLHPSEDNGLLLASSGVLTQIYSIPPISTDESARVSFIVTISNSANQVQRILLARTTLATNPLTLPLIENINKMKELEGAGFLLDESNRIIYHSDATQLTSTYEGQSGTEPVFYDQTATDGTRQLVYYQPVIGRPWAVVLTVPAQQAQQFALDIAWPLSLMIIVLALVALIILRVGLRVVTGSLQGLAVEANRIAQGNLDNPLQVDGVDEVGQLRRAFEQMRSSLQGRLEEINSLLRVSQGVSSSLEMQDAVKPVLDAILATGASSVRVVLSPTILPDTFVELPSHYSAGQDVYAHLDSQVLELAKNQKDQKAIVFPNLTRSRDLDLDPNLPQPLALLAVALSHEKRYFGVVWAGYEQPRLFSDADIRFVTTLTGQAALAVANAYLFLNVEASRQQLEAIISSTPDPVLVTDRENRLLLRNRAAALALGQNEQKTNEIGMKTEKVVKLRPLLELLQSTTTENQSAEIVLANRTYLATASSVMVEGRQIGRVCIMRDVTHFKELDMMKSEFVATVSHDLRSPLTLMRGYATMLEMVGELNDQQKGYVKKIISGVENMSRLVNNLLDLGRIDLGVGLHLDHVTVLDIIERVTSALQLQATHKNIDLSVQLPKDMPNALEADEALLHQAVYNLVENGIKYTPDNGRVIVRTISQPGYLTFAIEDSGPGISAEDIPHLFEKFYRGKQRETRTQPGSGLGLAIVHSIATNHGGRVWVDSVIGRGSTFYLQIPLTQPKASKTT